MTINLTEGRITALRAVASRPGLYASAIAGLFPRGGAGWSRQGATRWGCGYAQPLVNAGLVRKDAHVDGGGARYYLTDAGRQALLDL